jgi:putative Mg2+ transporter-C (MgtC) family protein
MIMDAWTIFLRLLLTFILSFIFGFERQKRTHKPIGFGTFIFVSMGACAIAIAGLKIAPDNPLPILGAIITGIGFLGAGALIKTTDKIMGFTSAATIWVFAIFGLLAGIGSYFEAGIIYAIIWIVFFFDGYLEVRGIGSYQKKVVILTNKIVNEKEIEGILAIGSVKFKKVTIEVNKKENYICIVYLIEGQKKDINLIPQRLYEKPWFASFKVD